MKQPENVEELRVALLEMFEQDGEYVFMRTVDASLLRAATEEIVAGLTLSAPTACQQLVGAWLIERLEKKLQGTEPECGFL